MGNLRYYDNNKLKFDSKYLNGRKEIEKKGKIFSCVVW